MGFGFRKSFGSGPFRFTVSPRGVSSSFGVLGARITAGPRGTFVTISSHGVYYRHKIDAPSPQQPSPAKPAQQYEQPPLACAEGTSSCVRFGIGWIEAHCLRFAPFSVHFGVSTLSGPSAAFRRAHVDDIENDLGEVSASSRQRSGSLTPPS